MILQMFFTADSKRFSSIGRASRSLPDRSPLMAGWLAFFHSDRHHDNRQMRRCGIFVVVSE